jgi:hypothetical protein
MKKLMMVTLTTVFVLSCAIISVQAKGKPVKPSPKPSVMEITGDWTGAGPANNITLTIGQYMSEAAGVHTGEISIYNGGKGKNRVKIVVFRYDDKGIGKSIGVQSGSFQVVGDSLIIPAGSLSNHYYIGGALIQTAHTTQDLIITE